MWGEYKLQTLPWLKAVSRWPFTPEVWVLSWVNPCEICGGRIGTETGLPFALSLSFHLCSILICSLVTVLYNLSS